MPHRCSIGFRSSPLPSASLARQWSSWMCVWGRYHVGILHCGPVSKREGIMLCFSMSQYMLAFMVPLMKCSSPVPAALMQPQTMTLPPPCLTVVSSLEEASFWDDSHADQFHAAYGLSTDRLTPHPFNLCSNAGSTHTSISKRQPLDMTLSMCTQLLWSTMARPVLSGTCPVKPLYGLGHRAAAVSGSWQSSNSLGHLYVEQQFFFSDPQSSLP
ncbi:uncharacterized protein LOC130554978 [Triplophysa rosa]|uniref:uncharacterized protein LOC130554978 n=1 Tax=Triplophysa rosa TaxID=992332 RepID=UPI0025460FC6|nr:uncharacterized protein LOC130554978 [Triplophysa rosa]